jgi:flavin prenyltransferase
MIVAITGASRNIYGVRVLEALRAMKIESHLAVSNAGDETRAFETSYCATEVRALAEKVYAPGDVAAATRLSGKSERLMGTQLSRTPVRAANDGLGATLAESRPGHDRPESAE